MIDFQIKEMFFDRQAVLSALDKARLKVLSKFGAFVRQTARQSILKRRRGTSKPGQPPFGHVGTLKKFIYFGYDQSTGSVVVGPAPFGPSPDSLPALELGGPTVIKPRHKGEQPRVAMVAARPFMLPAFERERAKLPELWIDSVSQ